ncbi:YadA-like family protein, partial [Cloacibacillus porcorum]
GDATVDGMLYAKEGGVFSNNASDFAAGTVTAINGVGMDIYENGTLAAYYGRYGMKVGGLTYDGSSNRLDMGGGTITGLADGGVYRGSSDAVTGNQLWQAYRRMDDLQESINIVGAHAAALSGLAPVPYNPYQPTTLSAAFGTYRDEYAVAVGVYHYVRDNVMFNLGASLCSDGDMMGRAGISFAVGQKDKNKPALAQNMNDVQKQLMEVQYALQELKDENEALKKQLPKQ